jgi:N-acetylmuramoyl-L-alanine amidase
MIKFLRLILLSFIILNIIVFTCYAAPGFTLIYVVQEGDTLSEIAAAYGISISELIKANNLSPDSMIKLGDELVIPLSPPEKKPDWESGLFTTIDNFQKDLKLTTDSNYAIRVNPDKTLPEVNLNESQIINYHVNIGDTLYDIARSFSTSIGVIMALNNLKDNVIRVGDVICLPINNLSPGQILARTVSQVDIDLMARVIHGEARGEPFIGQVAVGAVIINRVLSSYFPNTFYQVIHQKGQFSAVANGQYRLAPNRTAYQAAYEALKGTDPTMGSMYYYNPRTASNQWWFERRRLMVTIGDHVFTK